MASNLDHHARHEYCRSRLKYRDSRVPTAVRVYTVASESRHLLVFGVPKINLHAEVRREFQRYGPLGGCVLVTEEVRKNLSDEVHLEQFTDVYRIVFDKLEHARRAKKFSDAKNFYGGVLHISYAPERETVADVRQKLAQRQREVGYRLRKNNAEASTERLAVDGQQAELSAKRKYDVALGEYVVCADDGVRTNKYRK